jgi:DNA-binding CsgD family transcriptional regulator
LAHRLGDERGPWHLLQDPFLHSYLPRAYISAVAPIKAGQQVKYVGKPTRYPGQEPQPGELGWVFEIGDFQKVSWDGGATTPVWPDQVRATDTRASDGPRQTEAYLEALRRAIRFTPRERQIVNMLMRGMEIREASRELAIDDEDEGTVRTHVETVREKLLLLIRLQSGRIKRKI